MWADFASFAFLAWNSAFAIAAWEAFWCAVRAIQRRRDAKQQRPLR